MRQSRCIGTSADDIYYPKLEWFPEGEYLCDFMITRESSSNLVSITVMLMEQRFFPLWRNLRRKNFQIFLATSVAAPGGGVEIT